MDSALFSYSNAFKFIKSPFARDISNAFTCAILENQHQEAQQYCKALILKGCPIEFFTKRSICSNFIKSSYFKEVEEQFSDLYNTHLATIDRNLITELEYMFKEDQAYRGANRDTDKMLEADDHNKVRLSIIINQYGYPSEDKIGLNIVRDTIIGRPNINIVFRHYFQLGNQALKDTLLYFVKQGELRAEDLAFWLDTRPHTNIGHMVLGRMNDTLYQYRYSGLMDEIRATRKELLLDPYEDFVKKTIFEYCDPIRDQFMITQVIAPNPIGNSNLPRDFFDMTYKKIGTCTTLSK